MRLALPAIAAALFGFAPAASAQDLYDQDQFRPFHLTFHQSDFWTQLFDNYESGTYIPADLTVDGVLYPDVGVRVRGQSTIWCSQNYKVPFRIKTDQYIDGQEIYGQDSFRLNNATMDPTFLREALMSEALREYIPMARRAFTNLDINGENWGVYIVEQQKDGRYAEEFFGTDEGNRYKAIHPAGLTYEGADPNTYLTHYEHVNGPNADSYKDLIPFLDALNNTPLGGQFIDEVRPHVDLDAALWMMAGHALFGNVDSYQGNTHNYYALFDAHQQRFYIQGHDLDLGFGTLAPPIDLSVTYGFDVPARPLVNRPWQQQPFRKEFYAHLKTMAEDTFDWDHLSPLAWKWHDMIDAAVEADPRKSFSYQDFKDGITQDVYADGPCLTYFPGLKRYVDERQAFVLGLNNVTVPRVELGSPTQEPAKPGPDEPVTVTVAVVGSEPAAGINLRYRSGPGAFTGIPMLDDGNSGDGAAGDGVFGCEIPGHAPGSLLEYVMVATGVTKNARTFLPRKSQQDPFVYSVAFGGQGLRITEYMYTGTDGELIELTNTSASAIDLTGWSLDDKTGAPGNYDLSAAAIVQPGESVVVTDSDAATFAAAWSLAGVTVLGDNEVAKLGRNDAVHVFDHNGLVVDRLVFGDEDFPGSPRAKEASAWVCADAVGMDDPMLLSLSQEGDSQGSWASVGGDVGSPGAWSPSSCSGFGVDYCSSNSNSTGLAASLSAGGSPEVAADNLVLRVGELPVGKVGYFLLSDGQANVPGFGGSQGVLCLAAPILRLADDVLTIDGAGEVSLSIDYGDLPGNTTIAAGETWNFQLWYRDVNPGQTSNTSNGLAILFE